MRIDVTMSTGKDYVLGKTLRAVHIILPGTHSTLEDDVLLGNAPAGDILMPVLEKGAVTVLLDNGSGKLNAIFHAYSYGDDVMDELKRVTAVAMLMAGDQLGNGE